MKEAKFFIIPDKLTPPATFIVGETTDEPGEIGLDLSEALPKYQGDQSHGDSLFGMGVILAIMTEGKNAFILINEDDYNNEQEEK